MSIAGKVIYFTLLFWLPILALFYLPNTIWGIVLKVLASLLLLGITLNLLFGNGAYLYGSAGVGFIINAVLFAAINFNLAKWINLILCLLLLSGLVTCYRTLKRIQEDPHYDGGKLE